jgi:hypothetical protein
MATARFVVSAMITYSGEMELAVSVKSRTGYWFTIPVVLLLGGAGTYFILQNRENPTIGIVLLGASAAFLIMSWFIGGYETRLVINDYGIEDRRLGVGLIPWNQIESVYLESKYSLQYLCLKVRSPEKFLDKLPHPKRQQLEKHRSLGFTIFNISVADMDIDPLDLLQLVRKMSKQPASTLRN